MADVAARLAVVAGPTELSDAGSAGLDASLERARAGDASAFEAVYREHVGRIFAICLRMTADPSRAEELTQDSFVRAWSKLDGYRGEAGIGAWLRRVAINVVLSDRRARASRPEWLADPSDDVLARVTARPVSESTAAVDLERAIASLPFGARSVFVMHDVEGYTHQEIGSLLEIAPATSKTQLHRARKLLREVLQR